MTESRARLSPHPLATRFSEALIGHGVLRPGEGALVALSGGMDSTVLLHLLRFARGQAQGPVVAAHFDHGMRSGSEADARWVRGLCSAWATPLHSGKAGSPPNSEAEAREARFKFLWEILNRTGFQWLLTGHHRDDQVETVLFRIARGTGLRGLAGIPLSRSPGLYRPLLGFTREELRSYARAMGVPYRNDPTNHDLSNPRNLLRHRILPDLQRGVSPGVRDAVDRLARLARENEEAWTSILPRLLEDVVDEEEGETVVERAPLLSHPQALQVRILREILRRRGVLLEEAGTKALMEFTRTGVSGGVLTLPGGWRFIREFGRFRIMNPTRATASREALEEEEPQEVTLASPDPASGTMVLGGIRYAVTWGQEDPGDGGFRINLVAENVSFPLRVRGWEAGDRLLLSYGTKKVKKLLAEARIPVGRRNSIPLLVDAHDRVLWVAGVAQSVLLDAAGESSSFHLGIRNVTEG